MNEKDTILDVFSYSEREREAFSYLDRYMRAILPIRDGILDTTAGRERYMLAGLFLTYRAFNHWGRPMTTESLGKEVPETHRLRLSTFKSITGKSINSTGQYLKMVKANWIKILLIPADRWLLKFVIKG